MWEPSNAQNIMVIRLFSIAPRGNHYLFRSVLDSPTPVSPSRTPNHTLTPKPNIVPTNSTFPTNTPVREISSKTIAPLLIYPNLQGEDDQVFDQVEEIDFDWYYVSSPWYLKPEHDDKLHQTIRFSEGWLSDAVGEHIL